MLILFIFRETNRIKLAKIQAKSNSMITTVVIDEISTLNDSYAYCNTIQMMCCIIQMYRFDVPSFIPQLILSLIKHINNPLFKELITRTIQNFKLTHQSKWKQYSLLFTKDQLIDLQGTATAHYFT